MSDTNFKKIRTSTDLYEHISLDDLLTKINNYEYIVVWNPDGVVLEYADRIKLTDLEKFTELRAFGISGELALRSFAGEYRGRILSDIFDEDEKNENVNYEYLDEDHLLWGDEKKNMPLDNGKTDDDRKYTFLSEDRGTQLILPFDVPSGKRAFVKVRNYLPLAINEDLDFRFTDWRFVEFFALKAEKEGK